LLPDLIRAEIVEEARSRVDHHHVLAAAKRVSVSLQAAVKGIKLFVLTVGIGIGPGSNRITFTAQNLTVAFSFGQDNLGLPICVCTNTSASSRPS
jgi:hypothetical protein